MIIIQNHVSVDLKMPVKSGQVCTICEMVLGDIRSALKDKNNEKTIEQLLEEVCNVVPPSYKGLVGVCLL